MRVIGGRFKGRTLKAPSGHKTRPTSDRVRESMFNILEHGVDGFSFDGIRVLDLFAGTGALGIEALSRGAAYCLFVEDDPDARGVLRENVEALQLTGVTKIWRRDATRLGPASPMPPFHLIFADPPYGTGAAEAAVAEVVAGGWIAANGVVVIEEAAGQPLATPPALRPVTDRTYGTTSVSLFTLS
jgi:16S rRNA (guanine966-N2)-methyltransferase